MELLQVQNAKKKKMRCAMAKGGLTLSRTALAFYGSAV